MGKKSIIKWIAIVAFFIVSLFFVENGIAGSSVVSQYNDGYGTFDMKSYNANSVTDILSRMDTQGLSIYKWYYFFDFIFIIAFGLFQCAVSISIFKWLKIKNAKLIVCIIPLVRGIADLIENLLLLITLFSVSSVATTNFGTIINFSTAINGNLITVASFATSIKLFMIELWIAEIILGIFGSIIIKIRNRKSVKA